MSDKNKSQSLKMLILTGNKAGDSSLGLDSSTINAINLLSLPFLSEFEENFNIRPKNKKKRKNSSSDDSFERNSNEVRSISAHSEIKEEPIQAPFLPSHNIFESQHKYDNEDFENYEPTQKDIDIKPFEEKTEPLINKPEISKEKKRKYSYEQISVDRGPDQFLKVLGKDAKQRFFKLSDLYYPTNDDEYQELKSQIDNENEKNSFPKLASLLNLKERRFNLREFFQNILTKVISESKTPSEHPPIQNQQQIPSKAQPIEHKNLLKFIVQEAKPLVTAQNLPRCFNKINSKEFFQDLEKSLLRELQQELFIPETENYNNSQIQDIKQSDFLDISFRDPSESLLINKNTKQYETPALDMGFQEPASEKRLTDNMIRSTKFSHLGSETPALDMGFQNEVCERKGGNVLKTEQMFNDEEELLLEFNVASLNPENKLLWGEMKGLNEKNEGFISKEKLFSTIFHVKEERLSENPNFNNFSRKELFIKHQNQANIELFDLKQWWKKEVALDNQILININDISMFFEPIHSKLKKKPEKINETIDNNLPKNEEMDLEDDISRDDNRPLGSEMINENDTWSMSSKNTNNRPFNSKIKQSKLKEMRIQAVKEGIDPQSINLNDEVILRKKLEEKEKNEKKANLNTNLWQIIENSKKLQKKTKLQHSQLAEKFVFNNFQMSSENTSKFHRFDLLAEIFEKNKTSYLKPWKIELIRSRTSSDSMNPLKRKRTESSGFDEINEMVDSYEFFKSRKRISCKSDKNDSFVLFEYIEENPLILSNLGMASKLYKYIYPQRVYNKMKKLNEDSKNLVGAQVKAIEIEQPTLISTSSIPNNENLIDSPNLKNKENEAEKPQKIQLSPQDHQNPEEEIQKFKELVNEALGSHGSIYFLRNNEKIPLIGQLVDEQNLGILILENNLFNVSVFKQKIPTTDFLLVRTKNQDNNSYSYTLRKIEHIYLVGQIEPKLEVFSPNSRMLSSFIRRCLKFEIKQKFKTEGYVDLRELGAIFPSINDHNIRKTIRELGGEQDLGDNKLFHYNQEMIDSENEHMLSLDEVDITPEEMCLYERMHACLSNLKEFGLCDLRNADKINLARNKYIKKNNQNNPGIIPNIIRKNLIARLVAEELHLTSWNLSQSFLTAKQTQGRLYLSGFGDPTNGHGGYSYVKKPLKTSRFFKKMNFL